MPAAPPVLVSTTPSSGTYNVPGDVTIVLTFNEPVQVSWADIELRADFGPGTSISLTDSSQVTVSGNTITIKPTAGLRYNNNYRIYIPDWGITDLSGTPFAGLNGTVSFTISPDPATMPPLLWTESPADHAQNVDPSSKIVLGFTEAVKPGIGLIELHNAADGSLIESISPYDASQVTFSGETVTINPTPGLAAATGYYLFIPAGAILDLAGNAYAGLTTPFSYNFSTPGGPDVTPPAIVSFSPAGGASRVPTDGSFVITFNEPVKAGSGTIHFTALGAVPGYGSAYYSVDVPVTDAAQVTFSGDAAIVHPSQVLSFATSYELDFDPGVFVDLAGNPAPFDFEYFSTIPRPIVLTSHSPINQRADVPVNATLSLSFDQYVVRGIGNIEIHDSSDGSLFESIPVSDTNQVRTSESYLNIVPAMPFLPGHSYYVIIAPGVIQDFGGMTSPTAFTFTTQALVDTTPPILLGTFPSDATTPDSSSAIGLGFSETIKPGVGSIEIRRASDGALADSIFVTDTQHALFYDNDLTLFTDVALDPHTQYYVLLAPGVITDIAGNTYSGISSPTTFQFTTGDQFLPDGGGSGTGGGIYAISIGGHGVTITSAPANLNDFNFDYRADVLWQNAGGQAAVWLMNGTSPPGGDAVGVNPGTTWHVRAAGDFDDDLHADILWQNDNGQVAIWLMNGTSVVGGGTAGPNPGTAWRVIGAGDFNRDGYADILWQNTDGTPAIWLMNGTTVVSSAALPNPGSTWHVIGSGDFNGDGKSDILLQNDNGQAAVWLMDGTTVLSAVTVGSNPGTSWRAVAAADFNDDLKADILWQNVDGTPAIWFMNGTTVTGGGIAVTNPGSAWHAVAAGDYNGDHMADIFWQNTDGTTAVWLMNGTSLAGVGALLNTGTAWHVVAMSS